MLKNISFFSLNHLHFVTKIKCFITQDELLCLILIMQLYAAINSCRILISKCSSEEVDCWFYGCKLCFGGTLMCHITTEFEIVNLMVYLIVNLMVYLIVNLMVYLPADQSVLLSLVLMKCIFQYLLIFFTHKI